MQALAQQSSRGLEQSKTLRVFDGHHAARSVLDCGSPLPLSSADTRRKERNLLAKDGRCRPDGAGLPRRSQTKAGEFLVWVSTKMSRLRRWENCGNNDDLIAETFERGQNHKHQMKKQITLVMKKLRMIHFLLLLITSTVAVGSAVGQQYATSPIPAEQKFYLKDYDAQTSRIRAGFIPYKAQLVWGEPLQVTFTVKNLGTNNFKFEFSGDYRGTGRHERFKINIADADGNALPDPIAHPMFFGGLLQSVNLKTGQVFTNVIDLTTFRVIAKPGIYTVNCNFAFDEGWGKKDQTNPVVNSTFTLTILERTPERVAKVLDELVSKAQAIHGQNLGETLALIARFGKDDAVPRLVQLTKNGSLELRATAIGALSMVPTDASLDIVLTSLKDSDPTIRAAAAGSLGAMQKPRGVDALLDTLPKEKSPVAEAIVLALGTSKSDRAFPVITNTLDAGEIEIQRAAVNALVNFGGSNAVAVLIQHINTNYLSLRYEIVWALTDKLHQPLKVEWLQPILIGREPNQEWRASLYLLREYAGDQVVPELLSYLDFDAAWSERNFWILDQVKTCSKAPHIVYEYDPNSNRTPEQRDKNLSTLQALKALASPISR